jgi:hypothetical protein
MAGAGPVVGASQPNADGWKGNRDPALTNSEMSYLRFPSQVVTFHDFAATIADRTDTARVI